MMWEFWVITGKLRVVFPLGKLGLLKGSKLFTGLLVRIYRVRGETAAVVVDVFSTYVL